MSKPTLDSDLYGDIYGDDDNDYADQFPDEQFLGDDAPADTEQAEEQLQESTSQPEAASATASHSDTISSLPAKPSTSAANLSYSAQIAKQFSAYQQTPSQERQLRSEIPLPPNPRMTSSRPATFAVPTIDGSSANGTVTTSGDTVFGKKPSEMHDSGKMFVGGLSWDTTDEGLRDYFSQFGKVDACTIMRDPSGTSRGFAFMTFENASSVNAVIGRDHFLDGKSIDPKRAIPREEHMRNTRYFVGGLSPTTTSDTMRAFFSTYGKVVDATVMIDRETGRGKGFGFVTFEDAVNSDQIVGKIGLVLDDKQIEVKAAQPRNQRDQGNTPSSNNRSNGASDHQQPQQQSMNQGAMVQNGATGGMNFMPGMNQQNPMTMLNQRFMNQMPMGMMNMNPMMGMMGMGGFGMGGGGMQGMMNMGGAGVGAGTGGMDGMANMGAAMGNMANMGAMRLGMGPMGALGMGAAGMGVPAMLRNNQMGAMRSGGMGRMAGVSTVGPSRTTTRGQHGFHPYAR